MTETLSEIKRMTQEEAIAAAERIKAQLRAEESQIAEQRKRREILQEEREERRSQHSS